VVSRHHLLAGRQRDHQDRAGRRRGGRRAAVPDARCQRRNWAWRKGPPLDGLDRTLLTQRNEIREMLGRQWRQAVLLAAGRLAFDYLCLLAALQATGGSPRPSLVLVAYAVSGIVGMIPVTPGGLGIVEASLAGLLVLAGTDSSQAALATLAYRLASYWLPLLAGPVAYGAFHLRYRQRAAAQPG
jgi:uncharacterized protein (TIRG00374 family)